MASAIIGKGVGLFQFLENIKLSLPGRDIKGTKLSKEELLKQTPSVFEYMRPILPVLLGITAVLFIAGILILIKVFRPDNSHVGRREIVKPTYYYRQHDKQKNSLRLKLRGTIPAHPVRREMSRFERKARKKGLGRRLFETLGEWIERNGWELDAEAYEKVRYGEVELSEGEALTFRRDLRSVGATM